MTNDTPQTRPKIRRLPRNARGKPLIRACNVSKLELAAAAGDAQTLERLGRALASQMRSQEKRDAIESAVADLKTQMFQAPSRFSIVMLPASIEYSPPPGRIETPSTTVIARHTDGASGRENSVDARKGLDDPTRHSPQAYHGSEGTSRADWGEYSSYLLLGPEFRGPYRDQIVEIGHEVSITSAKQFLASGMGVPKLVSTVNTPNRRARLQEALERFENGITKWRQGDRRNTRVTWIIPVEMHLGNLETTLDRANQIFQIHGEISGNWRAFAPNMEKWLPWLSLELVHRIYAMTSADLGFLRRCMVRLSRSCDIADELYPWTPGFSPQIAELPIHALFGFEPTATGLRTLNALSSVFCCNIGHLAAFDPEAWRVIHRLGHGVWSRLAVRLKGSGPKSTVV